MPTPIKLPGHDKPAKETTVTVNTPGAVKRALAGVLTALSKPDSVVMGLIRHGLTVAGGILVSRGFVDSNSVDQLIGAAIVAVGTGWSWAVKYVVTHWLQVAVLVPANTTRAELEEIVAELPRGEATKGEVTAAAKTAATKLVPLLLVLSLGLSACKDGGVVMPGLNPIAINNVISAMTGIACTAVRATDRPAVSFGLRTFLSVLNTDPTAAMAAVNDPDGIVDGQLINTNLGMGWVWNAIHLQLDKLGADGWSIYGVATMRGAVTA